MPTPHLRIVPNETTTQPTDKRYYHLWGDLKGGTDPDEIIQACSELPILYQEDAVIMTETIHMLLDLGDLDWSFLVACLALHRIGVWGDADDYDQAMNDLNGDVRRISFWRYRDKDFRILAEPTKHGIVASFCVPADYE